ncbi:hypothetical protein COW80_00740 [Candidatus Beckwithbacteria bacterium CG22_combo_CG10-13_8_21_14_all_01_47_9]|uniref:Type 4a pilus biogenesis protein PilO n=5 Tax=Candidatus Beckwithiibacteriota TaxID=1752726 RepID=A0A2H0E1V2_9BACT|nr:MAG: hypothetical protein AUJ59_00140 [Candidatus Beckwithbacteria bacterium CG1_02_47_37]PIP88377.1 MAG: hypothetical protein COW80_00740 [Candidatus Beckwithbacteria bacterium CG22_combo_CG10-13_8_21_14_all_01_47_9]PJA22950.1 MAG: hypothetical protein COX59_01655 [Candidatus Beckwithbacteria bacterium CG_4_10_14_0_2_um_filter_47_25]PJC66212.1 MAG: hypothetical protein CO018_03130 [Candidatus Beckwithbacteria bacterium CG_4_9_14_0_2_um_filter_47_11]
MNLSEKLTGRTSYFQYYNRLKLTFGRPTAKVSSLAILTIFTVIFFILFAIMPTFKTIASLRREIDDTKTVEAKLRQKIQALDQAEILFGQVSPGLNSLNLVLPPGPEFERLAWQFYWLAGQNQLTIVNGTLNEFKADFVPVDLTLTGSYPNIKKFVDGINRLDRLIGIDELTISAKAVRSADGTLSANFKLKAFYLKSL